MRYMMTFSDIASGAVADTFKTIASIINANTAGHRHRVRSLYIAPSQDAPTDVNIALKLSRTSNATAGTAGSTVTAANMPKVDPNSLTCLMTGGRNYSVEPTVYDTEPMLQADFNARGGFYKEWLDPDSMPRTTLNQTTGLLVAPRTAVAVNLSGFIEYEIF